jgi:ankyrin repeat protein
MAKVKKLLNGNAALDERDGRQSTPLHHAVNYQIVDLLCEHKHDVNAKDKDNNTPLHWAVLAAHPDLLRAEALVRNGADTDIPNNDGNSPRAIVARAIASPDTDSKKRQAYEDIQQLFSGKLSDFEINRKKAQRHIKAPKENADRNAKKNNRRVKN